MSDGDRDERNRSMREDEVTALRNRIRELLAKMEKLEEENSELRSYNVLKMRRSG